MTHKPNAQRRNFGALFVLFAGVAATLATAGFSSSIAQTVDRRVISSNDVHHVIITGEDIRNLPPGESRIVEKIGGGNATGAQTSGNVYTITFGGAANTSVPLTKTGTGTLIFPNSNNFGVTKVGPGSLENSPSNTRSLTKELTGTLILTATEGVVYEFRNMATADFDRIFMPNESTSIAARIIGLRKVSVQSPRSSSRRVLIGSAKGIAQLEGWKPGLTSKRTPASKFVCSTGGSCQCSGTSDCLDMAAACSSEMTCVTTTSGTTCSCTK